MIRAIKDSKYRDSHLYGELLNNKYLRVSFKNILK